VTRQSIFFAKKLDAKRMDHRVKPGGDDRACVVAVNPIDRNAL
jgi:hypothetical protein